MENNNPNEPVSFDEFRKIVADELQIDPHKVVREASFIEDLRADSIQLVSMMLSLEEKGINIPMEAAWDVETVGDAFRLYQNSI
ncbi:MAG: acyl carrier protein [Anaerolineales bacterium]|jgi:acyl carrier protein